MRPSSRTGIKLRHADLRILTPENIIGCKSYYLGSMSWCIVHLPPASDRSDVYGFVDMVFLLQNN
jgi:hypothetical protein